MIYDGKRDGRNVAVIYRSYHHGNTKKLLNSVAKRESMMLIDAKDALRTDLSQYDTIGFASGIYFWNFDKTIPECAEKVLTKDKKVFLVYTCSIKLPFYTSKIKRIFRKKKCKFLGQFACKGYNTYSVFKKMGGIAKDHPNEQDKENARKFYRKVAGID